MTSLINAFFCVIDREALNLAESPPHGIKRERDSDRDCDYVMQPTKKVSQSAIQQLQAQLQQSQHLSSHNHYKHELRRRSLTPPSPPNHHRNRSMEREQNHHHHYNNNNNDHSSSRRHMSASPPPSAHRNGTNSVSHNGSNDLLNACSPLAMLSGMQFKLSSRGM